MKKEDKMLREHLASTLAMMRRHCSSARVIGVDSGNDYSRGWSAGLKVGLRLLRRHLDFGRRNKL